MAGFLTQLVDGVRRGFKGAAKSALAYYDGSKWTAKEAGDPHQILSLDENGDLEWITASYDYVPLPVSPQNGDMLVYQDGWKKLDKGTAGQILGMTATLPAFKDSATHLAFCIKTPVDNDKSVKYVVREPLSLKDVNIVFTTAPTAQVVVKLYKNGTTEIGSWAVTAAMTTTSELNVGVANGDTLHFAIVGLINGAAGINVQVKALRIQ